MGTSWYTHVKARTDEVILLRDHHEGFISWERFRAHSGAFDGQLHQRRNRGTEAQPERAPLSCKDCLLRTLWTAKTVAYLREPNRGLGSSSALALAPAGDRFLLPGLGWPPHRRGCGQLVSQDRAAATIEVALKSLEGVKQERDRLRGTGSSGQERAELRRRTAHGRATRLSTRTTGLWPRSWSGGGTKLWLSSMVSAEKPRSICNAWAAISATPSAPAFVAWRRMWVDLAAPTTGMRDQEAAASGCNRTRGPEQAAG